MTRRLQQLIATAAIALWWLSSAASAQSATAPALKAAFLYNFAKFTEWPAQALAPHDPLMLCVMNDREVGETLVDLTRGRTIDGHALVVSTMRVESADLLSCRLLFMSGLDLPRSRAVVDAVAGKAVLTVSDFDTFAQLGGVAHFFVEEGTMRFAVNLDAAHRAGVRLSSKLLSLARIVKDDRAIPHP
jgi:uncharacterized protein DUF4154